MKELLPIERMVKMGETTKLQVEFQKLREKEAHYTKTLQPWQAKVSANVVGFNEKLLQAKRMQMVVTSLLQE
jgi:cyclopropane fatty-acyl-phospholipid synthase-like methyltransferase